MNVSPQLTEVSNQLSQSTAVEATFTSSGNTQMSNNQMALVSIENAGNNNSQLPKPKNLQELLHTSTMLQLSSGGDSDLNSTTGMDPEREAFLKQALASLSVDIVAELNKYIEILSEIIEYKPINDLNRYETTFEAITDQVCSIDMANVFYQVGGLKVIIPLLSHPLSVIRWRAASIITECCQNNPFCKALSSKGEVFSPLLKLAEDPDSNCQFKAIAALSAIVRDNPEGIKCFLTHKGVKMVQKALQYTNEKIIARTAILIMALCETDDAVKDELLKTQIVEKLILLVRFTDTWIAEHILGALLALIRNHDIATAECLRQELGFYEHIILSISLKHLDESCQEYVSRANEIVQIMDNFRTKTQEKKEKITMET